MTVFLFANLTPLAFFFLLVFLTCGRPRCAGLLTLLIAGAMVAVNALLLALVHTPLMPEYLLVVVDLVRHFDLYWRTVPGFGWMVAGFCATLGIGLAIARCEPEKLPSGPLAMLLRGVVVGVLVGCGSLLLQSDPWSPVDPDDLPAAVRSQGVFGFFARMLPGLHWPARQLTTATPPAWHGPRPDIFIIQSESLFDIETMPIEIPKETFKNIRKIRRESVWHGPLNVPAWGANTYRTEFSFLTGLPMAFVHPSGYHPYATLTKQPIHSLARMLSGHGYRTIGITAAPAAFLNTDPAWRNMGFATILGAEDFSSSGRVAGYPSDRQLTERIVTILGQAEEPLLLFVTTMENHHHGPEENTRFDNGWPGRLSEETGIVFSHYLNHAAQADRMVGELTSLLRQRGRPALLAFYGDHPPPLLPVYRELNWTPTDTFFLIWSTPSTTTRRTGATGVWSLAAAILEAAGLPPDAHFRQVAELATRCEQGFTHCRLTMAEKNRYRDAMLENVFGILQKH
ncbi:MAG: LTA synthase family protein [Magnetococcales bacterium]|nr:LTA synthase family protein [Magnetococcales bacterium]